MMRLVGISGSLRSKGNTETAVRYALAQGEAADFQTEFISLAGLQIEDCHNCGVCPAAACPIADDVPRILEALLRADAILIGTPVYFGDISGALKCVLDRCVSLKRDGRKLAGKVATGLAVGSSWGHSRALETVHHFILGQGMIPCPVRALPGMGLQLHANAKGDLKDDPSALNGIPPLMSDLAHLCGLVRL